MFKIDARSVFTGPWGEIEFEPDAPDFFCEPDRHRPVYTENEIYCASCGMVFDLPPVARPASFFEADISRQFGSQSERTLGGRDGPDRRYGSLGHLTGRSIRDSAGHALNRDQSWSFRRMNYTERRAVYDRRESIERRIRPLVEKLGADLSLPREAMADVERMTVEASAIGLFPAVSAPTRVAVVAYVTLRSRKEVVPVSVDDICHSIPCERKSAFKTGGSGLIARVRKEFKLYSLPPTLVDHLRYYMPRFDADPKMRLSADERKVLVDWLNEPAISDETSGNEPKGMVGGAVWLIGKVKGQGLRARPQEKIADLVGTTSMTVRQKARQIEKILQETGHL